MKQRRFIEDKIQKAFVRDCELLRTPKTYDPAPFAIIGDYLFAVPNGAKRSASDGYNQKLLGLKAGVPDMFLSLPNDTYHGLYIEFKVPASPGVAKGTLTENQKKVIPRFRGVGYKVVICYSAAEAITEVYNYLNNIN